MVHLEEMKQRNYMASRSNEENSINSTATIPLYRILAAIEEE